MSRFPTYNLPGMMPQMPSMAPPDPMASMYSPQPRKKRKKKSPKPTRPLSDEEANSLVSMAMGMASGVGNFLDVPGSMARDVLAGENPFDQILSPLSGENRTTGVDLLRQYDLAGEEDTWGNFAGGLATEIVTDPLTWLTGPLGTLAKGSMVGTKAGLKAVGKAGLSATDDAARVAGKVAGEAAERAKYVPVPGNPARTFSSGDELGEAFGHFSDTIKPGSRPVDYLPNMPAAIADQIRRGERGWVGARVPFTDKQLWSYGAGSEAMPWLIERGFYGGGLISNKLSIPIRGIRSLFSHTTGGAMGGAAQKAMDIAEGERLALVAGVENILPVLDSRRKSLLSEFKTIAEKHGAEGDNVAFNEFMRSAAEAKAMPGAEDMFGRLQGALGDIDPSERLRKLSDASREYVNTMVNIKDAVFQRVQDLGGDNKVLDDIFSAHFPRRGDFKDLMKYGVAREDVLRDVPGGTVTLNRISRDELLVNVFDKKPSGLVGKEAKAWTKDYAAKIKVGTVKMREWLKDHNYTVPKSASSAEVGDAYLFRRYIDPELLKATDNGAATVMEGVGKEAVEVNLYDRYVADWTQPGVDAAGRKSASRLGQLRGNFGRRPENILKEGLFNDTELGDWQDYMQSMLRTESTLRSVRHMLSEEGLVKLGTQEGHVSLLSAWGEAGFTGGKNNKGLLALAEAVGHKADDIENLTIPSAVATSLKAYKKAIEPKVQKEIGSVMKGWDRMMALYRGSLTTPFPAFHARNGISGIFQEMTAGKLNAKDIMAGKKAAINHMRQKGEKLEYFDEIMSSGILGGKGKLSDVVGELGASQMESDPGTWGEMFAPMKGMFSLGKGNWDFRNMRGVRHHADDVAAAAKKGKPIDPKLSWYAEWGEKMYGGTEFVLRAGYYEALRKKGYTAAQAKHYVMQAHFDYSKLSHFEKKAMRRGALFYTWKRKSVPYTLQVLAELPGGAKAQAIRALNVAMRGREKGYMPQYLRERSTIPVSTNEEGQTTFLSQGGLPIEDLNMVSLRGTWGQSAKRSLEQLLAQTNPVATNLLEFASGRQFHSGRKLRDLSSRSERLTSLFSEDGQGTPYPWIDRAINMTPASRLYGEGEKVANLVGARESGRGVLENAANLLTGARFTTPDAEKYKVIDALQGIRDKLESESMVREATRPYVPQKYKDRISPEVTELLLRLHELERLARKKRK